MSNVCTRCEKTVYPMEELRCLDKLWHKVCFRCTECSTPLNLNTFKSAMKMPYCKSHVPKDKATVVLETPESLTAIKNTRMQSKLNYQKGFEAQKGLGIGQVGRKMGNAAGEENATPPEE